MAMAGSDHGLRQTREEEQLLYDYLLDIVRKDSPEQVLEDFRCLFVEGRGYGRAHLLLALEKVVKAKDAQLRFYYFFNRCCHILINRWQMSPQEQPAIPALVELLENLSPPRQGQHNTANYLRYLVKSFTQSEHYVNLQRLSRVIGNKRSDKVVASVGTLINRYPYLYDHCLLGEESSQEHQQTVRSLKSKTERRFEVNLSRYVTYKVRLAQLANATTMVAEPGRIIQPVKNPTLLSDRELNRSLKQYVGTFDGGYTYKSLSQSFLSHSVYAPTYRDFKKDLYEYLMTSMKVSRGQFPQKLYSVLQNTLPQCDHQRPSEFLMLRTSSQLLNYLVVESSQKPEHYIFVDMISNMGVTGTVGMLLKLVLMCNKVKPYLEKRFSILFNHYEGFSKEGVPWLVQALENMQIAFSIHFGRADLSCLRQIRL
jgi:hypothetical protein